MPEMDAEEKGHRPGAQFADEREWSDQRYDGVSARASDVECEHDWVLVEANLTMDGADRVLGCTMCPATTYEPSRSGSRPRI